ncbi:MAG: hypothetical protein KF901_21070 [Myxococcales bacterium]|nr:hypothetical protein [Myxococcales bacterium]
MTEPPRNLLDVLLPPLGVFALLFGALCLRDFPELGLVALGLVVVGAATARFLRPGASESSAEEADERALARENTARRR